MVNMIVGNFHVSASNRTIIRAFYDRMKAHPKNMTLANRQERKQLYRHALECHKKNQELYRLVITGRF